MKFKTSTHDYNKKLSYSFVLLIFSALFAKAAQWPPKIDGIENDPEVKYGVLENGVRWAYLPNAYPEDQLSLRLVVETGSFMEEDEEVGIAHFLEHMAFNGTVHFPDAGQVVEMFQRHGVGFGSQLNAQTGFLRTVYRVDLPSLDDGLLSDAFMFLEDQAAGQVFEIEEIEKERGVILEEMRTRNSPHYRAYFSNLGFLLGEGRLAKRSPIGTEASVKSFQKEDFEKFYKKWYTADRMIVVGVGALPVEIFEEKVKASFAAIPVNASPLPNPNDRIEAPSEVAVHFTDTPDSEHCILQYVNLNPIADGQMDYEGYQNSELKELALTFLSIHFNMQVASGGAPFLQSLPSIQKEEGLFVLNGLVMVTQPNLLEECLNSVSADLKAVQTNGFAEAEEARMKQAILAYLANSVERAPTRQNAELAAGLVGVFGTNGRPFIHPSEYQRLVGKWFKRWSGKDIAETLQQSLDLNRVALLIQAKLADIELDKEKALIGFKEGISRDVKADDKKEKAEWAYADFGAPGKVLKQEYDEELEITRVEFENGVRANLKQMRTRRGQAGINLRLGAGRSGFPSHNRAASLALPFHFQLGALGKHDLQELQQLTMTKQMAMMPPNMGDIALEWNGGGSTKDFQSLLESFTAYLTDPGFRSSGHALFQQIIQSTWKDEPTNPDEVYEFQVKPFLFQNDWRFTHPSKEEMRKQTMQASVDWIRDELNNGYLEIGIAGDFKLEEMIEDLASTVGTLPKRVTTPPVGLDSEAPVLTSETEKIFVYEGPDPKASLVVCIPTFSGIEWEKTTRLKVLAQALENELNKQIREEMGGSYGVKCSVENDWDFPNLGKLIIRMECDPERMGVFIDATKKVLSGFHNGGIESDMLKRALKPKLSELKNNLKEPNYWLGFVLSRSQGTPWMNERMEGEMEVLEATSLEDLKSLAGVYLDPAGAIFVQIVPKQVE